MTHMFGEVLVTNLYDTDDHHVFTYHHVTQSTTTDTTKAFESSDPVTVIDVCTVHCVYTALTSEDNRFRHFIIVLCRGQELPNLLKMDIIV